ncbi:unnamed protein product [Cuscuta campestris]|uniref:Aminotransferase-like plant mobile domain-containing protein n=1 Tax=Cuscuta campestris TaxID=132261 RepID=A0A484L9K1_9ASTE|nr:unnamed protein product [Cuscuta campestris]
MGITLQDVECLLGLPINGFAFLGLRRTVDERDHDFLHALNWTLLDEHLGRPDQFKIKELFPRNPEQQVQPNAGWTNREVEQYTARVIYGYLAGLLFPDSSGRFAPTDFVSYLGDFDTIANFSWGSAVLQDYLVVYVGHPFE